jgi:UDP-2,3-diacylglucosamine pyrophosphatase LpxH
MAVVREIIQLATSGTKVIYITGNHDEAFRRFAPASFGNIQLVNKYTLNLGQKSYLCFHGDAFDRTTKGNARILAKIGGWSYDLLIMLNCFINKISSLFNGRKYSLSKKIKNSVKEAVKWIANYEYAAAAMAAEQHFHGVICGHIHVPFIKQMYISGTPIEYLNSGDWIEHCSALEYHQNAWHIHSEDFLPAGENIKDWFDKDHILEVLFEPSVQLK